ncbi:MAG TPA: putative lipid II flippase FtsW [Gammaproteobacteria bacterium]|nr:putative lipid II flippase FtsW [Gammaproteobacteria bacterium]
MKFSPRAEVEFDALLVGGSLGLAVLGTLMVGSASISLADNSTGDPFFYLFRHLGAIAIGGVALAVAAATPIELWYRMNGLLLVAGVALLASVLLPGIGHTVNGSARWISLGPITLQPSEPARLCMLLYLASYAVRRHAELTSSLLGFLKPLLLVGLAGVLLLAEPDFGALVVLTSASLGVLFVAGARLRDVALAFIAAGAGFAVLSFSASYRLERLTAFLDPWADPYASGFQLTQSLIAIGRGDWLGVGLGESVQKMFYLPEAHTDFVFAVLAEELGFVGSTAVIALFGLVVFRAIAIGQRAIAAGLPFHGLVATGIGLTIGLQAFINIGVNTGLLPTKGLTLPLLSYGRSSTIVTLAALGLLVRIYHELRPAERRREAAGRDA